MPDASDATASALVRRTVALAHEHSRAGRVAVAGLLYAQALHADPGDTEAAEAVAEFDDVAGGGMPNSPTRRSMAHRLLGRARPVLYAGFQRPRVWKYRALSSCPSVSGRPIRNQPVLFLGQGRVILGEGVQFGWRQSPLFYTGYCHVEAARGATIELADRVEFNNNAMLKSEGPGIRVGADGLFGAHVEIFDSNFHDLEPRRRRGGKPRMAPVDIGPNVFVGMGVRILKGVTIGADTVVGAGAVVTSSLPPGVIAAGNPARIIREL